MVNAPCRLLDVNILLALAWPQHVHHRPAHTWFRRHQSQPWSTCAITQAAFVRISANPRITVAGVTTDAATRLLGEIVALPGHEYWSELPALNQLPEFGDGRIIGHKQVTDLYLLALARHRQGRLVTLDRGIGQLLSSEAERRRWVELIG